MTSMVPLLLLAIQGMTVWAKPSPVGSCGAHDHPDCVNDMCSCGNACCSAEFTVDSTPGEVFDSITSYLIRGGADGLFTYVGGTSGLAGIPGDWTGFAQGKHQTYIKKYNDTLDVSVRAIAGGGSVVRVFSVSDIAGALGDMGQNRRTVTMLASDLTLGGMTVLFGCGSTPSLPVSSSESMNIAAVAARSADTPSAFSFQTWTDRAFSGLIGAGLALFFVGARARYAGMDAPSPYTLLG